MRGPWRPLITDRPWVIRRELRWARRFGSSHVRPGPSCRARLTAYELQADGIPVTLITDNMAGYVMGRGLVDAVVVGADRVAANGDVANKTGTYSLAILPGNMGCLSMWLLLVQPSIWRPPMARHSHRRARPQR